MKRGYIAIALLLFLIIGCTLLSRYVTSATAQLAEQISVVEAAMQASKGQKAPAQPLEALLRTWETKRPYLLAITGRSNCEPIEATVAVLPVWLEDDNYGEFMAALSQLSAHVNELQELQSPTLDNLF